MSPLSSLDALGQSHKTVQQLLQRFAVGGVVHPLAPLAGLYKSRADEECGGQVALAGVGKDRNNVLAREFGTGGNLG